MAIIAILIVQSTLVFVHLNMKFKGERSYVFHRASGVMWDCVMQIVIMLLSVEKMISSISISESKNNSNGAELSITSICVLLVTSAAIANLLICCARVISEIIESKTKFLK